MKKKIKDLSPEEYEIICDHYACFVNCFDTENSVCPLYNNCWANDDENKEVEVKGE